MTQLCASEEAAQEDKEVASDEVTEVDSSKNGKVAIPAFETCVDKASSCSVLPSVMTLCGLLIADGYSIINHVYLF